MRRLRGTGPPSGAKKFVELAGVPDATDIDRWKSRGKVTDDLAPGASQQPECLGKYRLYLVHALFVRKACLKSKQPGIKSSRDLIGKSRAVCAEYCAAAREVFEQPNLPI